VSCLCLIVISLWDMNLINENYKIVFLGVSSRFGMSSVSNAVAPTWRMLHIVVYLSL
jgi:hypothetical protein